ncbi:MAG: hypothetical protein ACREYF_23305, partial [Gammaproteobacteria bacterium]
VSAGVPLTEVRDLLGHSTVKMTERYAHLAPENIRAAVAVLDTRWSRSGHARHSQSLETHRNRLRSLMGPAGLEPATKGL